MVNWPHLDSSDIQYTPLCTDCTPTLVTWRRIVTSSIKHFRFKIILGIFTNIFLHLTFSAIFLKVGYCFLICSIPYDKFLPENQRKDVHPRVKLGIRGTYRLKSCVYKPASMQRLCTNVFQTVVI